MITEAILSFFFNLIRYVFELLPDFSWSLDAGAASYFMSILEVVCYMLPIDTFVSIAGITIDLIIFRIIVSVIRTLWDIVPFL